MNNKIINGNNIELLKEFPDNHFDSIVTDPPYGLGKEPNAEELMKDWIEKGYHEISGSGFMGKEWDAFVPQPIFWKEIFRVLKPGGHVLAFYGSRTYDWGVMAMRFAGFEVRDTITWHFGSGFPKSHNISKAIDKMYGAERQVIGKGKSGSSETHLNTMHSETKDGKSVFGGEFDITSASTDQAKQWDGWGSALKPASEYICLARKP
jgi:site-specific DNA-methyltransferase (adenine-specific)